MDGKSVLSVSVCATAPGENNALVTAMESRVSFMTILFKFLKRTGDHAICIDLARRVCRLSLRQYYLDQVHRVFTNW
jgi:hypothetical protein